LTEARVSDKGKAVGMTLRELEVALRETEARVIGLVRGELRIPAPSPLREIRAGDILLIQADSDALASALSNLDLTLEEDVRDVGDKGSGIDTATGSHNVAPRHDESVANSHDSGRKPWKALQSNDVLLTEVVVLPSSDLVGHTATDIRLRNRFGINLLAVSRQGRRAVDRLRTTPLMTGDVLLMQGSPDRLAEFETQFGCAPLAERPLHLPDKRKAVIAMVILATAVAATALGWVSTAISFATAVLASIVLGVVSLRTVYRQIDWPVVVLLGAMIPVAGVMAETGTADLLAGQLLGGVARGHPVIALTVILIVSMTLSDVMNNAATAAIMCPIAIGTADRLGANPDAFLMAVAIGASCAFLTPIGHQNNTLILGPGGFRFSDYWRLGLPLEAIVVVVGIPMIMLVWPL
jgi:di/tricarboxylate transporter